MDSGNAASPRADLPWVLGLLDVQGRHWQGGYLPTLERKILGVASEASHDHSAILLRGINKSDGFVASLVNSLSVSIDHLTTRGRIRSVASILEYQAFSELNLY